MRNTYSSVSHLNDLWFSREEAFSFLDVDLESQIRIKKVLKLFQCFIENTKQKILLDIGCGDGRISKQLITLGYRVYGIDISRKLVGEARKKGVIATCSDVALSIPFSDGFFDYVFAGEIIEHIIDTELILREISRVLRKNGVIVITTPNLVHLPDRIAFIKGNCPCQIQPFHQYLKFHVRQFTHGSLSMMLEQFGFKIIERCSSTVVFERDSNNNNVVVNHSELLARLFPSLGASIIIAARKSV